MGIGDGLEGSSVEVDCSVGTIVWVRRRNGSWWPGRILGPDELSASHLMSPRSGTPVKLLGREDASVDWYNLEKSKRVKAFRCGEFDDCIEKAEKSQGTTIRKREKYARREDAIMHALELEAQQLGKKLGNCPSSKLAPVLKRELGASTERLGNDHSKLLSLKSQSLSKGLDSSLEEESMENLLYAQKVKHGKQSSWDEDNSEGMPRMRGLQDFGLKIAPKRKLSVSEGSRKPFSDDDHVPDLPSGSRSMEGANHVSSSRNSVAIKRKAQGGSLMEESLVKRRDRRRPLVQVLQSSAKLPVSHLSQSVDDVSLSVQGEKEQTGAICRAKRSRCVYLPAESIDCLDHSEFPSEQKQSDGIDNRDTPGSLMVENTSSGVMADAESDSSESDLDPEMDEQINVHSDSTQTTTVAEPKNSIRDRTNFRVQGQTESMSSEDLGDSVANGYMSHLHPHDQIAAGPADVGVSKWQLKGKRNNRNLMKRPMEMVGKNSNGSVHGTFLEGKRNNLKKRSLGQSLYHGSDPLQCDFDEDELIEKKPLKTVGFGNRRYPSVSKGALKDFGRSNTDIIDSDEDSVWEAERLSKSAFRGYWDESAEYNPMHVGHRLGNGKNSMLVDVDVQVRSSTYQGERVPLVSLMSKLNGKAIVGHPIQIEALEEGSSDFLLSTHHDFSGEPMGNDGSTTLQPVWRTARRTAMHRVPRPHPSSALNGDEGGDPLYSDPESKPVYKKPLAENPYQKPRKSFRPLEKRSLKKSVKKVTLSSQKTRTLSSIAIDQKSSGKAGSLKLANKSSSLDGLIKPENGPTTVTCIPVTLVYSRLLESFGRPPSRPSANHNNSNNGDTEKDLIPDVK